VTFYTVQGKRMRYSLHTRNWDDAETIAINLSRYLLEKKVEKLKGRLR
jgi:hypothetical protein